LGMRTPVKKQSKNKSKRVPRKLTLRNFNTYVVKPYYDTYCWGYSENGNKQYKYSTLWMDEVPYKSYLKIHEKPHMDPRKRDICLQDHLDKNLFDTFIFANANPFNDVIALHGDIDPVDGYGFEDCVKAVLWLKRRFFPDLYWEPSTSGRGVAFWIFLDFSTFPKKIGKFNIFNRHNCNRIIHNLSMLFTAVIDNMFFCHFDKFCGEYALYSFKPLHLDYRDNMGRLPCPCNNKEFLRIYHSSIHPMSYSDINKVVCQLAELLPDLPDIKAQEDLSHWHSINTSWLKPLSNPFTLPVSDNYLGRTFSNNAVSTEYICCYDPFERCRITVQMVMRILGRTPSYEEWNSYYENNGWNTGESTPERESRFNRVIKYVEKGYDPSKAGDGNYHRAGMHLPLLREEITPECLNYYNKNSKEKVKIEDIEMGLGYVGFVLCVQGKNNVGTENALTVNQYQLIDYVDRKVKEGEIARKMNKNRASIVFTLLKDLGYIEMVEDYIPPQRKDNGKGEVKKTGRSRKYRLTPKHPDYHRFLEIYGVSAGCIRNSPIFHVDNCTAL